MTLSPPKLINRVAWNQNFTYFAVEFSVITLTINKSMLEVQYNKLDFNRNVKLSLADQRCQRLSHLKNLVNVRQNQNFTFFAVGFSVTSLTIN